VKSEMATKAGSGHTGTALIDVLRSRRSEIIGVAHARGARSIHVFGSVARREERTDSDIDFLVELEPGRSLIDLSGLQLDLAELLGREVHVVEIPSTISDRERRVAARARGEAVPL
jgi:predicted nucleotidyltransferase